MSDNAPAKKITYVPKPVFEKVTHVALHESITVLGKPVQKMLFDGKESMPGIVMSLRPYGVHCKQGKRSFIVPFARCQTIVLADEE